MTYIYFFSLMVAAPFFFQVQVWSRDSEDGDCEFDRAKPVGIEKLVLLFVDMLETWSSTDQGLSVGRGSRFGTQKIVRFGTRERYRFGTRVRASRLEAIATTSLHCLVANCNPPHPPPPPPHPTPHPTRSLVCTAEVCFERPSKRVCVCV